MRNFLIPECYTEQELLIIIGFSLKEHIVKESGCSSVISKLKRSDRNQLAIGWIDQDPTKQVNRGQDYFAYTEVTLPQHKIRVLRKPNSQHYLIEVEDDFEKWFEPLGKQRGVRKEIFGITRSLSSYKSQELPTKIKTYMKAVVEANPAPFQYIVNRISQIKQGQL